jgi:hypothetical protein
MGELIDSVKGELKDRTTRNFKLSNVPVSTVEQFSIFCKEECGDVYAVGLQQLLKTKTMYENLLPLLSIIIQDLNEIKSKINNQKNTREVKTFGD